MSTEQGVKTVHILVDRGRPVHLQRHWVVEYRRLCCSCIEIYLVPPPESRKSHSVLGGARLVGRAKLRDGVLVEGRLRVDVICLLVDFGLLLHGFEEGGRHGSSSLLEVSTMCDVIRELS